MNLKLAPICVHHSLSQVRFTICQRMHHALEIQEILLNIFGHCYLSYRQRETSVLAGLARTCRAFKEPALDALWRELVDLSPLAQCLPEASIHYKISQGIKVRWFQAFASLCLVVNIFLPTKCYSFSRPLTEIEWGVLRSYTRRTRSILGYNRHGRFDLESVKIFLNPPTTEPLFPNLCYLNCDSATEAVHLLYLPLPSLISLSVALVPKNLHVFQDSLQSISKFSPNIKRLCIRMRQPDATLSNSFSGYICQWQNLQTVVCPQVSLDADALVHLSRMPALTQLNFMLSATLRDQTAPSDPPLFFSNLHEMTLRSETLDPISRLLSRIRLPAITDFTTLIDRRPSRQDVTSFLTSIQTSGVSNTIQSLQFIQRASLPSTTHDVLRLGLEDLLPCMAFSNLRRLNFDIEWLVGLKDNELLVLASAWPQLESLYINKGWGWNWSRGGGITPDGLLQLLHTCRSLSQIALAIDTQGYTNLPPHGSSASLGLTLPPTFYIDVLDSIIEAESMPAITAFFAGIAPCAWNCWLASESSDEEYTNRWIDVFGRANEAVREHY